jgi:uncharacterized protein YbbC (DUF1343 family)
VGRGTGCTFRTDRADFIDGRDLAAYLTGRHIPGVHSQPTNFTPIESNFEGVRIEGVRFNVSIRDQFVSTMYGLELAGALQLARPRILRGNPRPLSMVSDV